MANLGGTPSAPNGGGRLPDEGAPSGDNPNPGKKATYGVPYSAILGKKGRKKAQVPPYLHLILSRCYFGTKKFTEKCKFRLCRRCKDSYVYVKEATKLTISCFVSTRKDTKNEERFLRTVARDHNFVFFRRCD